MKKWLAIGFAGVWGMAAVGAPPNTITLDGRPIEYDATEHVGSNTNAANSFGAGNVISNLFVTWDTNYLYIALQGQEVNDKLTVMLDVDPGAGTGATTTTNWPSAEGVHPDYVRFNDVGWMASPSADPFGLDYQIASEGFYNNVLRVNYDGIAIPGTNNVEALFDAGNGVEPRGTPVDMVVLSNESANPLKGIEARIPWSVLYEGTRFGTVEPGEILPRGASLRMFAVLHNNDPTTSWSSDGIIPNQNNGLASLVDGKWTTADYIDIALDSDTNGLPDLAGAGDVNAPYITSISGVQSSRTVFVSFNEDVSAVTATNPAFWAVNGEGIEAVSLYSANAVILQLTNDLPVSGSLVPVVASGVEDLVGNYRTTFNYLEPAVSGLHTSVTVRFILNKDSGMGSSSASPRATTDFHINGSVAPLAWGYPPAVNTRMTNLNATQVAVDVVFPPGASQRLDYKYSAILNGTNNYEAIRLHNYTEAARVLMLPLDGSSLTITDYLGAAAAPLRDRTSVTNEALLYEDSTRGDAGVRQDALVRFRVDLSARRQEVIERVILVGSDPLRGFNTSFAFGPDGGFGDYPADEQVGWDLGGIEMYDDGVSGGDAVGGDGIYSVEWEFTTTGEGSLGNSLVAGVDDVTAPFYGTSFGLWFNTRSPRSFDYKFAVLTAGGQPLLSPEGENLTYYLGDGETVADLDLHVWTNEGLPPPYPSNAPVLFGLSLSNSQTILEFEGSDLSHGVWISTNLGQGWLDYGHRAVTTAVADVWRATVRDVADAESYAAFSGAAREYRGIWFEPNPLPATGGVVNVYFNQHSRTLAGHRTNIYLVGSFNGWTNNNPINPMVFIGNGIWMGSVVVASNAVNPQQMKVYRPDGDIWEGGGWGPDGGNLMVYRGILRASWTPERPAPGEVVTITYDAAGGPLSNSVSVFAHSGFTEVWNDTQSRPFTNIGGTVWQLGLTVPTNAHTSINMVFNDGTKWDEENNGGRYWRIFIRDPEE